MKTRMIDALRSSWHSSPLRSARTGWLAVAIGLAACSPPPPPPPGPALDTEQVVAAARSATRLEGPVRIVFQWSIDEPGARFRGRGVARVEPPYRARLDLFLPGGETVARAALVDGELRIPAGVPDGIIPPAHLLWGSLGVFHPGTGSALVGGERLGAGSVKLRYALRSGQSVHYTLEGSRIREVEILEGGHVIQQVAVRPGSDSRFPEQSTYRDLTAYRELIITRESVEHVEPYPPDIWNPVR